MDTLRQNILKTADSDRTEKMKQKNKIAELKRTIESQRNLLGSLSQAQLAQINQLSKRPASPPPAAAQKKKKRTIPATASGRKKTLGCGVSPTRQQEISMQASEMEPTLSPRSPAGVQSRMNRLRRSIAKESASSEKKAMASRLSSRVAGLERELVCLKEQYKVILERCQDPTNATAIGSLKNELNRTVQMMEEKGNALFELKHGKRGSTSRAGEE